MATLLVSDTGTIPAHLLNCMPKVLWENSSVSGLSWSMQLLLTLELSWLVLLLVKPRILDEASPRVCLFFLFLRTSSVSV